MLAPIKIAATSWSPWFGDVVVEHVAQDRGGPDRTDVAEGGRSGPAAVQILCASTLL